MNVEFKLILGGIISHFFKNDFQLNCDRLFNISSHGQKATNALLDFNVQSAPLPLFPSPLHIILPLLFLLSDELFDTKDAESP